MDDEHVDVTDSIPVGTSEFQFSQPLNILANVFETATPVEGSDLVGKIIVGRATGRGHVLAHAIGLCLEPGRENLVDEVAAGPEDGTRSPDDFQVAIQPSPE